MLDVNHSDLEVKVLNAAIGKPSFARWALLCRLMSDGVYNAAECHDNDLPRRGWFHVCARYLAVVPERPDRNPRLAPHEFLISEIDAYCTVFRPVVRSFRHYLERVYPGFDSTTGAWSRAGKEDRVLNPFPFFLREYLPDDEDDGIVSLDLLFRPVEQDCGEVFQWSQDFFTVLARMTDDYDAELDCGEFAGNLDDDDLRLVVSSLNRDLKTGVSESELNTVAHMMVSSYKATIEMHQSILQRKGVGRFAQKDFDRSELFLSANIQPVLVVFQSYFLKEIERCGLRIQQYSSDVCDAISLSLNLRSAWQEFFKGLKQEFKGDPTIIEAESVALKLVDLYADKIASEGGGLHISAEKIAEVYNEFVRRLERVSPLVSMSDCGDPVMDKVENNRGAVNIQGCQNVQIVQDNGRAVQHVSDDKPFSCFAWTIKIIGGVITTVIAAGVIWLIKHCMSD